jgi:hypothetical protein
VPILRVFNEGTSSIEMPPVMNLPSLRSEMRAAVCPRKERDDVNESVSYRSSAAADAETHRGTRLLELPCRSWATAPV